MVPDLYPCSDIFKLKPDLVCMSILRFTWTGDPGQSLLTTYFFTLNFQPLLKLNYVNIFFLSSIIENNLGKVYCVGLSLWNNVCWSGAAVNLLVVDGSKSWRPSCSGDCSHVQDWQSQVWDNSPHLDPEICYQLNWRWFNLAVGSADGLNFKPPPSLALFFISVPVSCYCLRNFFFSHY